MLLLRQEKGIIQKYAIFAAGNDAVENDLTFKTAQKVSSLDKGEEEDKGMRVIYAREMVNRARIATQHRLGSFEFYEINRFIHLTERVTVKKREGEREEQGCGICGYRTRHPRPYETLHIQTIEQVSSFSLSLSTPRDKRTFH